MYKVLLVSSDDTSLFSLAEALEQHEDVDLSNVESGEDALRRVSETSFDLVVADRELGDMTGLELAGRLLGVNPMTHCAIVSPLSAEDFHEASEGLGLMAQLPISPDRGQAEELLKRLKALKNLEAGLNVGQKRDRSEGLAQR